MNVNNILETALGYAKLHGKKITDEESFEIAIKQINHATENLLSAFEGGSVFYDWLADARFREAMLKYDKEAGPILDKYGTSDKYAVLSISPEADANDIRRVCDELDLSGCSSVILENDEVIEKYMKELKAAGFDFSDDWRDEKSVYRRMLKAGKANGKVYEMVDESPWTYKEIGKK